jgi:hypothetical protein
MISLEAWAVEKNGKLETGHEIRPVVALQVVGEDVKALVIEEGKWLMPWDLVATGENVVSRLIACPWPPLPSSRHGTVATRVSALLWPLLPPWLHSLRSDPRCEC